jgi:hypothetical protein
MPLQQREEIQEMPRTQVKTKAPLTKLAALPERKPEFIEPMECALVPSLPEGPQWTYEILCGEPHKISSVAPDVMWRWGRGFALGCP